MNLEAMGLLVPLLYLASITTTDLHSKSFYPLRNERCGIPVAVQYVYHDERRKSRKLQSECYPGNGIKQCL